MSNRRPPAPVLNDRQFFRDNPDRRHRVRLAHQSEIEEANAAGGFDGHWPLYILVRQIEPGARLRSLVALRQDWTGCGETRAAALWSEMAGRQTWPVPVPLNLWGAAA